MYTGRGKVIPRSTHVQEFNPISLYEVNMFDPINTDSTNYDELLSVKPIAQVDLNLNLPIALKKERELELNHLTL